MKYWRLLTRWANRFVPPVAVMALVYWFSEQSTLPGPGLFWSDFLLKKTAHIIMFGLLFFYWQRALNWKKDQSNRRYAAAFWLVLVYALVDEVHQSFIPGRHPKLADIGFDMLGALLVYVFIHNRAITDHTS